MYNQAMTTHLFSRLCSAGRHLLQLCSPTAQQAGTRDSGNNGLLDAEEIVFLICVEANQLEAQALMLCSSIRRYAGRYKDAQIVAVSPRPHLALSAESRGKLQALNVSYESLPLNDTGSPYGTINRIVVGAWAEKNLPQPYIVVLDTDMAFISEPQFVRADAGIRPVDNKGSATTGPDDPLDLYWKRLCDIAGITLSRLPMLKSTIDNIKIRASYNGGFSIVKRELGILQRTKDIFFTALHENLRPLSGRNLNIMASTGYVGHEASEWWGSSQAALSIAIWSITTDVYVYDSRYNIPLHVLGNIKWKLPKNAQAVLLHIHYLAEPEYQMRFLDVVRRLNCSPNLPGWLQEQFMAFNPDDIASVCLCTLAIHEPYRERARDLCNDAPHVPWVILTDEPDDFADLPVRAIAHKPTGPMAIDYLTRISPTGQNRGAAAYHDKRFAMIAALENHDTAIFLDADSRFSAKFRPKAFPSGISVLPLVRRTIAEHLQIAGAWRLPAFIALAEHLTGSADILHEALWCHESCIAITKDGLEPKFFEIWGHAAAFMQEREVFSGEGGCIGLAAKIAGWSVDYDAVAEFERILQHEGGGPKSQ